LAKKPDALQDTTLDFEQALKELEEIVERMERGDATLEESLKYFERGIALTRRCQETLKAAEQKVEILIEQNGKADVRAFKAEEQD
jgi:exodeoxyribonuclease VII small subunit